MRLSRPILLALALTCAPALASFINYSSREINVKIVYLGPSSERPSQALQYIHAKTNPDAKGKLIKLATEGGGVLFFDFLPLSLGEIRGFKIRFHLYSNAAGPIDPATQKLILKGVDGIVFVADSDPARSADNVKALAQVKADLAAQGYDWQKLPFVFQLDHRDHPKAVPVEKLKKELGITTQPAIEAIAGSGVGIFEALKGVAKLTLLELRKGAAPSDAGR